MATAFKFLTYLINLCKYWSMVNTMSLTLNKPAPCIFVYENALTEGEKFISLLEEQTKDEWSPLSWDYSRTGSGRISEYRSSRVCSLMDITKPCPSTPISDLFNNSILKEIRACLSDYTTYHGIPAISGDEGWIVLKYEGEAQYRTHWDHAPNNGRTLSIVSIPSLHGRNWRRTIFPPFQNIYQTAGWFGNYIPV